MKWWPVILCFLVSACDFTVPLSLAPQLSLDQRVVGLWEGKMAGGNTERLLVLPLNDREYLLSWPKGANTELYARAHLFEYSGLTLVQLQWFGNSDGIVPDSDDVYQVATYTITDNRLVIEMLNPEVVGSVHKSTADLAAAIEKNRNNAALFHNKMVYDQILE